MVPRHCMYYHQGTDILLLLSWVTLTTVPYFFCELCLSFKYVFSPVCFIVDPTLIRGCRMLIPVCGPYWTVCQSNCVLMCLVYPWTTILRFLCTHHLIFALCCVLFTCEVCLISVSVAIVCTVSDKAALCIFVHVCICVNFWAYLLCIFVQFF